MRLNKIGLFQSAAKNFLLFFVFFFVFLTSTNNIAFAQAERPLEVKYISVPGATTPASTTVGLPNYIKYVFNFFIFTSGFIALGALVYASFRYVTSAGRPEAMKDAKDQILAAILGILILLSSWLILSQINPELVMLRLGRLKPIIPPQFSGILLCKKQVSVADYFDSRQRAEELSKQFEKANTETAKSLEEQINKIKEDLDKWYKEINDECYLVIGKGNLPDEWYDKIKKDTGQVYFIATKYTVQEGGQSKEKTKEYGIFLVNKGVTYDVYQWIELENNNEGVYVSSVKIASISSIIPYTILKEEEVENRDVITYEEVNYNQGVEDKKTQTFNSARSKTWQDLDFSPRSLAIKATNKTIVVLSTGEETQGIVKNGYVFTKDDPNLLKYYWITNISPTKCKIAEIIRGGCPAAKKIAITYGQIY